jgi:hypothetical protein
LKWQRIHSWQTPPGLISPRRWVVCEILLNTLVTNTYYSFEIVPGYRELPYVRDNPQWLVLELVDGFGSHINCYEANVFRAEHNVIPASGRGRSHAQTRVHPLRGASRLGSRSCSATRGRMKIPRPGSCRARSVAQLRYLKWCYFINLHGHYLLPGLARNCLWNHSKTPFIELTKHQDAFMNDGELVEN